MNFENIQWINNGKSAFIQKNRQIQIKAIRSSPRNKVRGPSLPSFLKSRCFPKSKCQT